MWPNVTGLNTIFAIYQQKKKQIQIQVPQPQPQRYLNFNLLVTLIEN